MTELYVLIPWPESQELMDKDWFDEEAVLHPDLSSAYFIPMNRLYDEVLITAIDRQITSHK